MTAPAPANNAERSVARGTFGSPTFFVGDEIFFGKDRLRDVEEAILATANATTGSVEAAAMRAKPPGPKAGP